ncbi:potassium ABC transporter ATPase [Vibrio parahaemolyticus]|nr:potassium ABC transporter ATPase [Vibrio parahaemolyticus]EGQ9708573.1 potassium ABC transporter ATPase [Vibrio parahaemolyticus]EGQ9795179.1 potassium ABC transporter ATPase [Vibrio parahaemolyticus]EGR2261870.1 potassium ABC transporter ATPase [Vibrio parahaemolyticus]EGR3253405.1 potassium ABC transporter ATPase [Vibrio parahaemolyticus]
MHKNGCWRVDSQFAEWRYLAALSHLLTKYLLSSLFVSR